VKKTNRWSKESLRNLIKEIAQEKGLLPQDLKESVIDRYCYGRFGIKYMSKNFETYWGTGSEGRFKAARAEAQKEWDTELEPEGAYCTDELGVLDELIIHNIEVDEEEEDFETPTSGPVVPVPELVQQFTSNEAIIRAAERLRNSAFGSSMEEMFRKAQAINIVPKASKDLVYEVDVGDLIIGVPDMHAPFTDESWFVWTLAHIQATVNSNVYRNIYVIQLGDAMDCYNVSTHAKTKMVTAFDEVARGLAIVKHFWESVPDSCTKIQLIGNHDDRFERIIRGSKTPELEAYSYSPKQLLTFPGVNTLETCRDRAIFKVKDSPWALMATHGSRSKSEDHAKNNREYSIMHGHLHSAGINSVEEGQFVLNCGHGLDLDSVGATYVEKAQQKNWRLALGTVHVRSDRRLHPSLHIK
jgi:hypothetical protein